ncbi:site-specific integrase, partial [Candidatus Gottesmanbacteria bacterium]|nr:site-specific integrase [Candidatus Gottesmanbacteria bacterium]
MTSTLDIKSAHAQFLDHLNSRRRAQATIVAYGKDIEQLVSFLSSLGKKSVSEIS